MNTEIATYSEADQKLEGGGILTGNRCITKSTLISNYSNVDKDLLKDYIDTRLIPLDNISTTQTDGLPYTPIFCVPFTDGTAKDIISGTLPIGGYTKIGNEHQFTNGGGYNITWSVPIDKGTFSIMYKFVKRNNSRAFLFGCNGYYTQNHWMGTGGSCMGIFPNQANGALLAGGNQQWPRGASTSINGEWTDDYHVVTFTYDFSKATDGANPSRPGFFLDNNLNAFLIYKDGILINKITNPGYNSMVNSDGTILSFISIGGGGLIAPSEWCTAYVKDARVYDTCLTPEEVKTLADICKQKA